MTDDEFNQAKQRAEDAGSLCPGDFLAYETFKDEQVMKDWTLQQYFALCKAFCDGAGL